MLNFAMSSSFVNISMLWGFWTKFRCDMKHDFFSFLTFPLYWSGIGGNSPARSTTQCSHRSKLLLLVQKAKQGNDKKWTHYQGKPVLCCNNAATWELASCHCTLHSFTQICTIQADKEGSGLWRIIYNTTTKKIQHMRDIQIDSDS